MKFMKKAAALFFCLALALSVMAITAAAEDPAPGFTLTLEQSAFTDHDDTTGIEVASDSTVTYNMKLKFTNSEITIAQAVSSLSFKVADVTGMATAVTFYEGANSATTQAATTKAGTGVTSYSFTAGGTTSKDFTLSAANTEVTIGTIAFTFNGTTLNHQTVTPTFSEANLQTRVVDNFNRDKFDVTVGGVEPIQVNPVYTMTLKNFTADGTTGQLPKSGSAYTPDDAQDGTLYYDYEGAFYSSYNAVTYTATVGDPAAKLEKAPVITAYEYASGYTYGWKVTSKPTNANSGWGSVDNQDVLKTVPDNRVGNVTLTAQYSPIAYNYKFEYNDAPQSTTATTGTYTIEAPLTIISNPTWTGYDFKGWSALEDTSVAISTNNGYGTGYGAIWTAYTTADSPDYDYVAGETRNNNLITTSTSLVNKVYGHVVLTAVWDEAGVFKKVNYVYAGTANNSLILYAVKTDDNVPTDIYKYNSNAMFKVPATKAATYLNNSAFDAADKTYLGDSYVMYAYIGVTSTATKKDVTIDKSSTAGNTELEYNGNVYRDASNAINTADYGNVDALLAANGGTASASTFDASEVRARLEADIFTTDDMVDGQVVTDQETQYGCIWDIKKIISLLT